MVVSLSLSQETAPPQQEQTCLEQWMAFFEKRGANFVPDGMDRNVIVSVTDKNGTECFIGKARVEGSRVTAVFIKYQDESFHLMEASEFKTSGASINNGISDPWITKDGNKTIRVVFKDKVKPPKKSYQQAPGPDDL